MYKIDNCEKYRVYFQFKWFSPELVTDYLVSIYGNAIMKFPYNKIISAPILEFTCENFNDVLRYFANHVNNSWYSLYSPFSYLSMCYIVDKFNRILYPSMYKYQIQKMIDNGDFLYQSKVINYNFNREYQFLKCQKKQFVPTYEFRKDPVPYSGKWICGKTWYFRNNFLYCVKYYHIKNFEIDREELDEMGINYYIPQQKKKERKSNFEYGCKFRHCDKSWKTSSKCKKQWMKHKKGFKIYDKQQYDIIDIDEEVLK